ncbi:MAG TPA: nicotinate-nucleotide diphosphorylase (carboxylating), partial [Candidatus Nitrosopelagicus sp.]|nr:nicotinate-nucleotide diphosphorylase (carboxylating) [Candidatus Nitrosopelagicus sp.]
MKYSPKRELKRFLDEDVAKGDITSKLLQKKQITAKIIAREKTTVAGIKFAKDVFALKKCKT